MPVAVTAKQIVLSQEYNSPSITSPRERILGQRVRKG